MAGHESLGYDDPIDAELHLMADRGPGTWVDPAREAIDHTDSPAQTWEEVVEAEGSASLPPTRAPRGAVDSGAPVTVFRGDDDLIHRVHQDR